MAQQNRLLGPHDRAIDIPFYQGADGQKDASAIEILQEYLTATDVGESGSLTLQGSILISPDSKREQGTATLAVEGSNRFRFDIQTSTGSVSTRVDGFTGAIQRQGQNAIRIPAETAMSGAFITPWLIRTLLNDTRLSVVNRGMVSVDGNSFLKLTLHRPLCLGIGRCSPELQRLRLTTDLYLNPTTHLLVKSAEQVRLSEQLPTRSLRVITYQNYNQVNGTAYVPSIYEETLNGQQVWIFNVAQASIGSQLEQSYFRF
jgi:hypothetical protein